jgi:hypothetical protein
VGLADRVVSPYIHEGLLLLIAVVLAIACLVAAFLLIHHAPAVSMGLVGAVIVGIIEFFVSAAHGPRDVPQDVGVWASIGPWIGGAIGVLATHGRPPSATLWHVAVACLVLAPFGAALLVLAIQQACPLYVMRGSGYCFYEVDVLGAWASYVTFLFIVDVLVVVALLLISGKQARRDEVIRLGDDEWSLV